MADEVSNTGLFLDAKTGKVVEKEPEEGRQLVPAGGVITPDVDAQIKAARAAAGPVKAGVVDLSVTEPTQAAPVAVPKQSPTPANKGR